jgi:hypothetical protein
MATPDYEDDDFISAVNRAVADRSHTPVPEIDSGYMDTPTPSLDGTSVEDTLIDSVGAGSIPLDALTRLDERRKALAEQVRNPTVTQNDAIESALTALVPALLGLAAGGKKGLGIGATLGGQGALQFRGERIKNAIDAAKIEQQGLGSIEQALRMEAREKALRERQDLARKAQMDRDEEARKFREGAKERATEVSFETSQRDASLAAKRLEDKENGVLYSRYETEKLPDGSTKQIIIPPSIKDETVAKQTLPAFGRALKLVSQVVDKGWGKLSGTEQATVYSNLVNIMKDVNNNGAAFTALEELLTSAGIPVPQIPTIQNLTIQNLKRLFDQAMNSSDPDKMWRAFGSNLTNRLEATGRSAGLKFSDVDGKPTIFTRFKNFDPITGEPIEAVTSSGLPNAGLLQESGLKRGLIKNAQGVWVRKQ